MCSRNNELLGTFDGHGMGGGDTTASLTSLQSLSF